MKSSPWIAGSVILALGMIAGCGPTPADRCVEFENEVQAYLDRCGVVTSRPFQVVDSERMPVCGRVHHLVTYDELPRVCYPFLQTVDCSTVDFSAPLSGLPAECTAGHFEYTAH